MSLPDGFDTEVGGKGSQLSGGQVSMVTFTPGYDLISTETTDSDRSSLDTESEDLALGRIDCGVGLEI